MSHQKYTPHDPVKEPHSVSVKVLRLSQPSLEAQYPVALPLASSGPSAVADLASHPASVAYTSPPQRPSNTDPFVLSPVVNLPASFGSAYVGETFSCTLCASNDLPSARQKQIRDVRVEAEMKTPGLGGAQALELGPAGGGGGCDLAPGETLQRVLAFDLKEEGNHVLAVTVSYYEATETSGRTRTFRKLYQFICKPSLIVRTKVSALEGSGGADGLRRWVLEAQLENCSEDVMLLEKVVLDVEDYLGYEDCNWDAAAADRPVLYPAEVEQVCFVVAEKRVAAAAAAAGDEERPAARVTPDGRLVFGVLGIGWRGEMGKRGFLSTGKLGARVAV